MTRTVADALPVFELVSDPSSRPPSGGTATRRSGSVWPVGWMPNEAGLKARWPTGTD
ncbi:MAG: hypothetical protein U0871_05050 [Gemmataceae bacterium]